MPKMTKKFWNITKNDEAKSADIAQLQKTLSVASFVKSLRFISKDEAAETFSKDIGEDFVSFIGTNPLQNVIDLSLKADYAEPDRMAEIKRELEQNRKLCTTNHL